MTRHPALAVLALIASAACNDARVTAPEATMMRVAEGTGASITLPANSTIIGGANGNVVGVIIPQGGSTWFRFAPPRPGHYRLTTCATGAFDSVLEVYDAAGNAVASNDDSCLSGYGLLSTLEAYLPGAPYYIRVYGYAGAGGTVTLSWTELGLTRETAVELNAISGRAHGVVPVDGSYWFTVRVGPGSYQFSTCNADGGTASFDSKIAVWANGRLAENDDACENFRSRVSLALINERYWVQVSGYQGAGGAFTLAARSLTVSSDVTAPTISLTPAGEFTGWVNRPVSLVFTGADGGSGVQGIRCSASGAGSFAVSTTTGLSRTEVVSADGETTITCTAIDRAGNVSAAITRTLRIDRTAPTIIVSSPSQGATYTIGQSVQASFTCSDNIDAAPQCAADPVGAPVNTSLVGEHTYRVMSLDAAQNFSSRAVTYRVVYRLCMLSDATRPAQRGSVVPVKLQLCDAAGASLSSASIGVRAVGVISSAGTGHPVTTAGHANPDGVFRYDASLGGYILNLATRELASGAYRVMVLVEGEAIARGIEFTIR